VFGARAGRAAALETEPSAERLVRLLAPELPAPAVQTLRQAMSRDAGVVRCADGLLRLIDLIEDLEAKHGRAAPLVAARLVAACAFGRTESRGGHFRADATEPDAIARRTFVRWSDLLPASAWKDAAE
jgi:L-aspartate oxidase